MALPNAIAALNVDDAISDAWVDAVKADIEYLETAKVDIAGWAALPALAFGAADGHTFTVTYAGDLTASVTVGTRIKLTHAAAVKYFIVTAHVAGTLTLYGGLNYALAAGAITLPFYSPLKAPVGFPLDPTGWTESSIDGSDRTQAAAVVNTWYNPGSLQISLPIGAWRVRWDAMVGISSTERVRAALSNANNTGSDVELMTSHREGAGAVQMERAVSREKTIVVAVKTTYFLNVQCSSAGGTTIGLYGTQAATTIRAVCAYL